MIAGAGYVSKPVPNEENGRPVSSMTSSARTMRRRLPGSMRGRGRIEIGEAGVRARESDVVVGVAIHRGRTAASVGGIWRSSITART